MGHFQVDELEQIFGVSSAQDTSHPSSEVALYLARQGLEAALDRLERINFHLHKLSESMIATQREVWGENDLDGNVLLRFNNCGPKCMGCPHPAWYVTRVRRNTNKGTEGYGRYYVTPHKVKTPGRIARVQRAPQVAQQVADALYLIDSKKRLVRHLSVLNNHVRKSPRLP